MKKGRKIIDGQVYEFDLVDIWSRPGAWSRQRAYIFLAVNTLVYAAMNVFIFWVHQARLFDFSVGSYTITYHKTLVDFLFFPISVHEAPVLIPIFGMLMATIIVVPILIAQLYGFWYSVVFALCVLLLAHLPVLSCFLVVCSFIAGVSKRKLPFKFGVALLSLLPIVLYFYVATRGATMLQYRLVDPMVLLAPWLLSYVAAATIAATVLGFARLVQYRPGGILVGMIPFFAIPVVLFHVYIGADQLEFRLLAHRYGPGSTFFAPVDVSSRVFQETMKEWRRYKVRDLRAIFEQAGLEFPYVAQLRLMEDRSRILEACEAFQRTYPKSRFIPNVLYLMGLAMDMRFDYEILARKWSVEYTTDLVSSLSRETWRTLIERYPNSLYAQPARYRLAVLALQEGKVLEGKRLLTDLGSAKLTGRKGPSTRPLEVPSSLRELFMEPVQNDIPTVNLAELEEQAQELLELIETNGKDARSNARPLADLLRLDPHHPKYRDHLLELAIQYSGSSLHDHLLVRYAVTYPDPEERRAKLEQYSKLLVGKDAGAEALFELGSLLQAWALRNMDPEARAQAGENYRKLIRQYPRSIYAARAKANLKRLAISRPRAGD